MSETYRVVAASGKNRGRYLHRAASVGVSSSAASCGTAQALSLAMFGGRATLNGVSVLEADLDSAILLARQFGATRLLHFGSAVDDPGNARDLDLACAGVPGWRLFELAAALEEVLPVPFDLVPLEPPTPFTRLIERRARVLL